MLSWTKREKPMPLNAVVDASVLVSAFLFPQSAPGQVLSLARDRVFSMHLSPILIEETRRSLLNPRLRNAYGHREEDVVAWCADLPQAGHVFFGRLPDIDQVCRDPDDDHVLAAAVAVKANLIVTGDKDLLTLGQFQGIRILPPQAFLNEAAE